MRSLVSQLAVLGLMGALITLPLACVVEGEPDGGTPDAGVDASVPPLSLENLGPHLIHQGARLQVPLRADGGVPPYSWELDPPSADSALGWVQLDPSTSSLTGFAGPPTENAQAVTVRVRDQQGLALEGHLLIDVENCLEGSTQACARTSAEDICLVGVAFCENGAFNGADCFAPDGGFRPSDSFLVCGQGCEGCNLDTANACVGGVCACGDGGACADGNNCCWTGEVRDCFDLQTSVDHCKDCGTKCPQFRNAVRSCTGGVCGSDCEAGWMNCPGDEAKNCDTHTAIDLQNCGGCGNACPASTGGDYPALRTCSSGICGLDCGAGRRCGDSCFNLNSAAHCGGCDNPCSAAVAHTVSATCTGTGTCELTCENGWADCDGNRTNGCEVDLTSDSANCGQCFRQCQGTYNVCSARDCVQPCGSFPPLKCSAPETCQVCEDELCDPPDIPCRPPEPCCR